jgi:hypothetical protein
MDAAISLLPMCRPEGEIALRPRSHRPSPRAMERGGTMASAIGKA